MLPATHAATGGAVTVRQLKGKTVITTQGTEMEQVVLAAVKRAGLTAGKEVKIIHASPDKGLNAFLHGDGDAYSGGVTERTEASKQGATIMIESADLTPPVIDGLVTTKKFAEAHEDELLKLIDLWFRTIRFMDEDLDKNSKIVIDYLSQVAATQYTVDQYKYTWFNTEVYPKTAKEMGQRLLDEKSPNFWKKSWDANNQFLLSEKKIPESVPHSAFWMEKVQKAYLEKFGGE